MTGWFFGVDEKRERFGVNLAHVTTVTLTPEKPKSPPVVTFFGEGDELLYTVKGKRAEKVWKQFHTFLEKMKEENNG